MGRGDANVKPPRSSFHGGYSRHESAKSLALKNSHKRNVPPLRPLGRWLRSNSPLPPASETRDLFTPLKIQACHAHALAPRGRSITLSPPSPPPLPRVGVRDQVQRERPRQSSRVISPSRVTNAGQRNSLCAKTQDPGLSSNPPSMHTYSHFRKVFAIIFKKKKKNGEAPRGGTPWVRGALASDCW